VEGWRGGGDVCMTVGGGDAPSEISPEISRITRPPI
jgi:hypothetical protein